MTIKFRPFTSISELKSKSEFIRKGKILPTRILKCSRRKKQHTVVTGSNQWAIPTKNGYLIFVENNDGNFESVLRILSNVSGNFKASPYMKDGSTFWQGNSGMSEKDFLTLFNEKYLRMNEVHQ